MKSLKISTGIIKKNEEEIKGICVKGIILRLFILLLIALFANHLSIYFMPDDTWHDDVRYIQFAENYRDSARSFWDYSAFSRSAAIVRHYVEYSQDNLWFAFLAVAIMIFRSEWIIRIINIIFAGISIYLLYDLTKRIYDEKAALFAAKLLAYLPYPVIFSCYIFKDQFVMMILLLLLRFVWKFRCKETKVYDFFFALIEILIIRYTRSGLDTLLLAFFGVYLLMNILIKKKLTLINIFIILLFGSVIVFRSSDLLSSVSYKLNTYFTTRDFEASRILRYMSINKITDIYRLPFSYSLVTILPLNFSVPLTTWYGIVTKMNICMIPIAVGGFINMFKPKKDILYYWGTLCLIFCTIIMSSMIFRHYYCFLPISLMHFSNYWKEEKMKMKTAVIIVSSLLSILCIAYF